MNVMNFRYADQVWLKVPDLREKLLENLRSLAGAEYQRQVSRIQEKLNRQEIQSEIEDDYCDFGIHFIYFEFTFDFVYDDTSLVEDHKGAIDLFFKNEREAQAIAAVLHAIERVFQATGIDAANQEYINSLEWTNILETVSHALQAINDEHEFY